MEHTIREVGPPAILTAVILSLGFAVFTLSRFADLRVFGLLAMTVLLVGVCSDMIVTNSMLRLFFGWSQIRTRPPRVAVPLVALALLVAAPSRAEPTPAAREIVQRMLDIDPWGLMDAEIGGRALLTDRRASTSELVFQVRARRYRPGLSKSLIRFSAPADLAGVRFLQIQKPDGDDDRFLFLPELRRSRRISGGLRANAFMGTDFSFADLDMRDLRDAEAKLRGEEVVGKLACWHIEYVPVHRDAAYARAELWVRKDNFVLIKWQMYDRAGALIKTFTTQEVRRVGGRWFISKSRMVNHRDAHTTDLVLETIAPRGDISDDEFTVRNLEK
jgi:hypothetical protein